MMWDTFLIVVLGFSTVLFGLITIYLFKKSNNNENKQLEFEEFSKKLNDSNKEEIDKTWKPYKEQLQRDLDILKNEDDILSDFQKILKFIHTKKEPILIEIERDTLDFSILGEEIKGVGLSDNDDHIPVRPETINLINLFLSNDNMSEILQSVNFELLEPAPSGKIKFFKMSHDAHKSLEVLKASMGLEELKQIS